MRVAAVVVTYNRKDLLADCLNALLAQTRSLDEVIVVDNASTDGTGEMIRNEFTDVTYASLPENSGGAGGFHQGIKMACQKGYDWIWCMDDDGLPARNALEKLLEHASENVSVVNCLVLSRWHPDRLASSLPVFDRKGFPRFFARKRSLKLVSELKRYSSDDGTLRGAALFNGSLLSVKAIRLVGNVNQAMFIKGDEVDMMWRLMRVGDVITVVDALHYHPEGNQSEVPLWKLYYGLRNGIYINNQYLNYSAMRNLSRIRRYIPRFFQSWQGIKLFVRAVWEGYAGILHGRVRP